MTKSLYLAAVALVGAVVVNAQAAPNWAYIPTACASSCAATVQVSYLCETQYSTNTDVNSCWCNNFPTDAAACSTCLTTNNAAALASLITADQTACPSALKTCLFECSFDTCPSSSVTCQCDATYLANIYNCGACNTRNGNTGATMLTDFQNLQSSCKMQNYTGAAGTFTTKAAQAPNVAGYVAPTLTASGGGAAATGGAAGVAAGGGAITGGSATGAVATPTVGAGAGVGVGVGVGTSAVGVAGTAGVATATPKSGANALVVPASGLLAVLGAMLALF